MVRGWFIRILCWLLRRLTPKHMTYADETRLAMGLLYRLNFSYALWMMQTRQKQMQKADIKSRQRRSGKTRRVKQ